MKYEIERLNDKVTFTIFSETFMSMTRPFAGEGVGEKEYNTSRYIGTVGFENETCYEVIFEELQRKMFINKLTNKIAR